MGDGSTSLMLSHEGGFCPVLSNMVKDLSWDEVSESAASAKHDS